MTTSSSTNHRTRITSLVLLLAASVAPAGCDEQFQHYAGDVGAPAVQSLAAAPAPSNYGISFNACMSYYGDPSYCCYASYNAPYPQCAPYWGD